MAKKPMPVVPETEYVRFLEKMKDKFERMIQDGVCVKMDLQPEFSELEEILQSYEEKP